MTRDTGSMGKRAYLMLLGKEKWLNKCENPNFKSEVQMTVGDTRVCMCFSFVNTI